MGPAECLVVVVDDDESVARAVTRLMRAAGFAVDTYCSGLALLQAIEARPWYRPDCVILDVCMPGIGGLEVQQHLVKKGLQVVVITAFDVPGVRENALAAGALGFLRKPFNPAQLIGMVRAAKR